ncbi:hypothetical protein LINGRAHAP2_LOCUS13811 [Linum grandiflorum]
MIIPFCVMVQLNLTFSRRATE